MKYTKAILVLLAIISLVAVTSAALPADWATNPHVPKLIISAYNPEIVVLGWFDNITQHFHADIGVVVNGKFVGLLASTVWNGPTFTADEQGYLFKAGIAQAGAGAGQVYLGTPILNNTGA